MEELHNDNNLNEPFGPSRLLSDLRNLFGKNQLRIY